MCNVRKWDPELQGFINLSEADEVCYQEGVRNFDFDKNLGAYDRSEHSKWLSLSNYISQKVIDKI